MAISTPTYTGGSLSEVETMINRAQSSANTRWYFARGVLGRGDDEVITYYIKHHSSEGTTEVCSSASHWLRMGEKLCIWNAGDDWYRKRKLADIARLLSQDPAFGESSDPS